MKRIVMRCSDGQVTTLYTDAINLKAFGNKLNVERASNVEYDNDRQGWIVQFVDGRFLTGMEGVRVFETREEALAAEVSFLQNKLARGGL